MADEHQFIEDGLRRSQINEFFADELGRAGYGGMDVAKTPMGTQIVLKAEKPGMVIGKGGRTSVRSPPSLRTASIWTTRRSTFRRSTSPT